MIVRSQYLSHVPKNYLSLSLRCYHSVHVVTLSMVPGRNRKFRSSAGSTVRVDVRTWTESNVEDARSSTVPVAASMIQHVLPDLFYVVFVHVMPRCFHSTGAQMSDNLGCVSRVDGDKVRSNAGTTALHKSLCGHEFVLRTWVLVLACAFTGRPKPCIHRCFKRTTFRPSCRRTRDSWLKKMLLDHLAVCIQALSSARSCPPRDLLIDGMIASAWEA
jgi:hypothetical protein